jgi:two-component system heavy metal sensor histidine kinase CusS
MIRWPLPGRIALWVASVVALVLLVAWATTAAHLYHEDLELMDRLLSRETNSVFSEIDRLPDSFDWSSRSTVREVFPTDYRRRNIQIRRSGRVLHTFATLNAVGFGSDTLEEGFFTLKEGKRFRLAVANLGDWQVRVAYEMDQIRDSVKELGRGFLVASPALILITGFGGWWIARRALSPIDALTRTAEKITVDNIGQRLPVPATHDEVWRLATVLNAMIERLERSLNQAQRFCADTSHELRTPLAVIHAGLESMLSAGHLTAAQEAQLLGLLDSSTMLSSLAGKLLLLARADAGHLAIDRKPVDLVPAVREALEEALIFAEPAGIRIDSSLPDTLVVNGDAENLMQVMRNLLENAVKYNRKDGWVSVKLFQESGIAHFRVSNSGRGLDEAQALRVFERFFRAEAHRSSTGHGLGLSISREIMRAHGGALELQSYEEDDIVFLATLPVEG